MKMANLYNMYGQLIKKDRDLIEDMKEYDEEDEEWKVI